MNSGGILGDVKGRATKKPRKVPAHAGRQPHGAGSRNGTSARGEDKVLENVLSEVTAEPASKRLEEWLSVACPYCGEEFEVHVTSEQDGQTMIEDCEVCCRPVSLHVQTEDDELQVEAYRS
ncbi:MAG: CPXCG motif-containing cysteine-rich protein [Elusimicrobia bacterium]|nr:CPXCG motif-containing cysteine-rich protein [Elusimicrobiota bacterium]